LESSSTGKYWNSEVAFFLGNYGISYYIKKVWDLIMGNYAHRLANGTMSGLHKVFISNGYLYF